MEEYKLIAVKSLTATEQSLYSNSSGAIIKTILLHNTNETKTKTTLKIDSVVFSFSLEAGETKILSSPILTKSLDGTGEGINIHITGLQLGGA